MPRTRSATPPSPAVALVVSGGGAKGAFAAGVIRYVYEQYRDGGWFSVVGGSSTGALIAPFAALLGLPRDEGEGVLHELVTLYTTVTTREVLHRNGVLGALSRKAALNETEPLRRLITRQLTAERFAYLRRPEAPVCFVVYTNFRTGSSVRVSPKDAGMTLDRFLDAMMASASVPVVMEPALIDGDVCFDGGARDVLPTMQAIELGAELIVPILLDPERLPEDAGRLSRVDKILFRGVSIMLDEILLNDYDMADMIRRGVKAREAIRSSLRRRPLLRRRLEKLFADPDLAPLLGPDRRLVDMVPGLRPLEAMTSDHLRFEPELMKSWLALGEKTAAAVLTSSPFDPAFLGTWATRRPAVPARSPGCRDSGA